MLISLSPWLACGVLPPAPPRPHFMVKYLLIVTIVVLLKFLLVAYMQIV